MGVKVVIAICQKLTGEEGYEGKGVIGLRRERGLNDDS